MSLTKFGEKLELRSEVEISATPTRVWQLLADLSRYSQWNPFIVRASGNLALGERIHLVVSPPGGSEIKVHRHVDMLEKGQELRWSGAYGWGLLLRSEQYLRLKPSDDALRTRVTIGENLYGPGVTGNNRTVLNISRGIALMNQALKRKCEE